MVSFADGAGADMSRRWRFPAGFFPELEKLRQYAGIATTSGKV